jgi:hypothetical protein
MRVASWKLDELQEISRNGATAKGHENPGNGAGFAEIILLRGVIGQERCEIRWSCSLTM